MLLYGCEAWILDDRRQRMLRGWNSRCLHRITGRGFREECVEPSMDIIAKVRGRRLKFLGHVLRREESSLLKQVLLADGVEQMQEGQYAEGSVLSEAPEHRSLQELEELAQERGKWRQMVHRVKSGGAAVLEVKEKSSSCERKAGGKQGSRKKTQGLADA